MLWIIILFFIDIGNARTMSNDATTSSSLLVTLIQNEEFKKHQLAWMFLNNRAKKLIGGVVCIRMVQLMWDRHVSPNLHILTIYLKLIFSLKTWLERFHVHLFYRIRVFNDGHYHWFKGPINSLVMEQKVEYLVHTIHQLIKFF